MLAQTRRQGGGFDGFDRTPRPPTCDGASRLNDDDHESSCVHSGCYEYEPYMAHGFELPAVFEQLG